MDSLELCKRLKEPMPLPWHCLWDLNERKFVCIDETIVVDIYLAYLSIFLHFLCSWRQTELEQKKIDDFENALQSSALKRPFMLPHGSYLINLGSVDPV